MPWLQVPALRWKTYTAPLLTEALLAWSPLLPKALLSSPLAPTASVLPSADRLTEMPKLSPPSGLEAFT